MKKRAWIFLSGCILLLVFLACTISFGGDEKASSAEQTLQAIYQEQTSAAEAVSSEADAAPASEEEAAPAPIEVEHSIIPGNPGNPDVEKDEIDTSNTADDKFALGDSHRLNNLERPFTEDDMVYHPETDLLYMELYKGEDFYYFTLELVGVSEEDNYPSASYGIEIDSDYDGRGDYLLWAKGDESTEWNIENVMLLEDGNDDVGGSNPVVPDNNNGNGYDKVLFSMDVLDDPDTAWKRVDPGNGNNVQLAVKVSKIDSSRFYWRAWADAGLNDPAQFDYNDSVSESQAGSPNKNSDYYPVAQLNLMDSTCWIAYNLQPTGNELGGCYVLQPTAEPPPDEPPPPPVCRCPSSCYAISNQACCVYCGCTWGGGEFPCF